MGQTWTEIKKEEITHCKICGKKIWKFWHKRIERYNDGTLKDAPEMDTCAVCFFNK